MQPIQAAYKFMEGLNKVLCKDKYEITIGSNYSKDGIVDIIQRKPLRFIERIYFEHECSIEQVENIIKNKIRLYL